MFADKIVKELTHKQLSSMHKRALVEYLANAGRLFYKPETRSFYVREGDEKLHLAWYI